LHGFFSFSHPKLTGPALDKGVVPGRAFFLPLALAGLRQNPWAFHLPFFQLLEVAFAVVVHIHRQYLPIGDSNFVRTLNASRARRFLLNTKPLK
jgi:hypothetical protein